MDIDFYPRQPDILKLRNPDLAEVATAWPAIQISKMIGALHLHGTTSAKRLAQNASKFNLGTPT